MIKLIIVLVILVGISNVAKESPGTLGFLVLVGIAVYIFIHFEKKRAARIEAEQDAVIESGFWVEVNNLLAEHISTLARKEKQMVTQDDYGNYLVENWLREVDYFIETVVANASNLATYFAHSPMTVEKHSALATAIIDQVYEYKKKEREIESFEPIDVESLDPIQFEHYCADILDKSGWNSRVTQASGDQGVDVVGMYGNIKAVFQCKKYSQPVGNAAVQEIIAGKVYEQAQIAVVVTNATFTSSAKHLAASADVYLLHVSELPMFAQKLRLF